MKAATQEQIIWKLNPIIKGWTNYYRVRVSAATFSHLDHLMWEKLWSWAKRRHSTKGRRWIAQKDFHTIGKRKWCFATKKDGEIDQVLNKYSDTKIKRHVKVRENHFTTVMSYIGQQDYQKAMVIYHQAKLNCL